MPNSAFGKTFTNSSLLGLVYSMGFSRLRLAKPPFDPCLTEVQVDNPPYLALRSSAFDSLATPLEVFTQGKALFARLNMAMGAHADADPVTPGAVIEFPQTGLPRRHHLLAPEAGAYRLRWGMAELTVQDAQGNIMTTTPPAASEPQNWMRAAALHSGVAAAMNYLSGSPGWVDLYKAHEALRDNGLAKNAASLSEVKRFTQAANAGERHREGKYDPGDNPMPLWEARSLMIKRFAAAATEVLKTPD